MNFRTIQPFAASLILSVAVLAVPAIAGTMWITLDDVPDVSCEEVWHELGIPMWFTTTEGEDNFPVGCVVDHDAEISGRQGVHLGPARLVIDLSGVQGADLVYMDVHNIQGSVRARMMDGTEQVYYHALSTSGDLLMFLPVLGGDTVFLSVADGYVTEIRLEGDELPAEDMSLGAVKILYGK